MRSSMHRLFLQSLPHGSPIVLEVGNRNWEEGQRVTCDSFEVSSSGGSRRGRGVFNCLVFPFPVFAGVAAGGSLCQFLGRMLEWKMPRWVESRLFFQSLEWRGAVVLASSQV